MGRKLSNIERPAIGRLPKYSDKVARRLFGRFSSLFGAGRLTQSLPATLAEVSAEDVELVEMSAPNGTRGPGDGSAQREAEEDEEEEGEEEEGEEEEEEDEGADSHEGHGEGASAEGDVSDPPTFVKHRSVPSAPTPHPAATSTCNPPDTPPSRISHHHERARSAHPCSCRSVLQRLRGKKRKRGPPGLKRRGKFGEKARKRYIPPHTQRD